MRLVGRNRGVRGAQRLDQQAVAEHLRRLREPQVVARLGMRDAQVAIGALQRVRQRNRQQPAGVIRIELPEQAVELLAPEAGPRGVMHQHPVGTGDGVAGREQTVEHARSARLAAAIKRLDLRGELAPVTALETVVTLSEHDENLLYTRMLRQRPQRVVEQRPPRDLHVLFRRGRAHADAGTGSGNQGVGLGHLKRGRTL